MQIRGLQRLQEFETWASDRSKSAKDLLNALRAREEQLFRQATAIRNETDRLQDTIARAPSAAEIRRVALEAWRSLLGEPSADIPGQPRLPAVIASVEALFETLARVADDWESLLDEIEALDHDESANVAAESLYRDLQASITEQVALEERLQLSERELAVLRAAKSASDRLVEVALPLLGDHCPVCAQSIDPVDVRERLIQRGSDLHDLQVAGARVEEAQANLAGSRTRRLRIEEVVAKHRAWTLKRDSAMGRVASIDQRISKAVASVDFFEGPREFESPALLRDYADLASDARSKLRQWMRAADDSLPIEYQRLTQSLRETEGALSAVKAELEQAALTSRAQETALKASRAAAVDVVNQRLGELTPLAQNVYSRLDPHPTFRNIAIVSEVYRASGTATAQVSDSAAEVFADPMIVFSSAQANIAAIAYLVALNWMVADKVPTLLLDDPLQAMDEINVLGFADLARHLRHRRQLLFSTHEKRFGLLLERKLSPRYPGQRTMIDEFEGWDRGGPQIRQYDAPSQVEYGHSGIVARGFDGGL